MNKHMIIGRLGADPVLNYTKKDGQPVVNFNVATNEKWKDKKSGNPQERTQWHRVVCFGGRAETIAKYLHKGAKVYVEGRSQTQEWVDKEGIKRKNTEILLQDFEFLDPKKQEELGHALAEEAQVDAPAEQVVAAQENEDDIPF